MCPNLVKVSLEALPSLRTLNVWNCGAGVLTSLVGVASLVTKLSIEGISGVSDEVWGGVVKSLGAVEELSIWKCNEIRYLWESEEEAEAACKGEEEAEAACKGVLMNLKKLTVGFCENLVRLGGGGGEKEEKEERSLTSLRIYDCNNLKHLSCPNSIEELRIKLCSSITSVSFPTVRGGGGGGWQKLKSLEIGECNQVLEEELEKHVLNNNTNIPPMLQVLRIRKSQYLKSIMELNCFIQLTRLAKMSCLIIIESFPDLQNLTSLKLLKIMYCSSMDGPPPFTRGVSGVWPPKLEFLEIGKLKRPISEMGPTPNLLLLTCSPNSMGWIWVIIIVGKRR